MPHPYEEIAKELGLFIIYFSQMERTLSDLIGALLGIDDGACDALHRSLGFSEKIKMFRALAYRRFPADRAKIDDACKPMRNAMETRNEYAHDEWGINIDLESRAFQVTKRAVSLEKGAISPIHTPKTQLDILCDAEPIHEAISALLELRHTIWREALEQQEPPENE